MASREIANQMWDELESRFRVSFAKMYPGPKDKANMLADLADVPDRALLPATKRFIREQKQLFGTENVAAMIRELAWKEEDRFLEIEDRMKANQEIIERLTFQLSPLTTTEEAALEELRKIPDAPPRKAGEMMDFTASSHRIRRTMLLARKEMSAEERAAKERHLKTLIQQQAKWSNGILRIG